jgi:dihydroflavonol-4-reductase
MKKAFVTGGTGFLGVNLINQLLEKGWEVTAIHRGPIVHPMLINKPVQWVMASLEDVDRLKRAMPKTDFTVFHLASDTTQWKRHYPRQNKTNVGGTQNMLKAATGLPVDCFVYTSSITAFGMHDSVVSETTPSIAASGTNNYAISKWQAEQLVREAHANGLRAVITNPCHIIGPWDTNNWIHLFKAVVEDNLPGIPPATGNFSWVDEVAKAHITAAERGSSGENYILGGPLHSMVELVNEVQRQLKKPISKRASAPALLRGIEPLMRLRSFFDGKEPQLTPDKVKLLTHRLSADDTKAQKQLGYKHKILPEMVEQTLAWLKN